MNTYKRHRFPLISFPTLSGSTIDLTSAIVISKAFWVSGADPLYLHSTPRLIQLLPRLRNNSPPNFPSSGQRGFIDTAQSVIQRFTIHPEIIMVDRAIVIDSLKGIAKF